MTGEDGKNYRNIVSKRWKEIKDPTKLSACNDSTRQMKKEAEKPAKLGDDSSVSSTEQYEKNDGSEVCSKKKKKKKKKCRDSPKKHQKRQSLLIQILMTQVPRMKKNLH